MKVLLIEDDPAEAEIVVEAFKEVDGQLHINVVEDGVEALAFLKKRGKYSHSATPDFILLDLNLPRMDGRAVLSELKGNTYLRQIPVIILSNSDSVEDIDDVYRHNGNGYVVKPQDMEGMFTFVEALNQFWGTHVRYSKARDPASPRTGWNLMDMSRKV